MENLENLIIPKKIKSDGINYRFFSCEFLKVNFKKLLFFKYFITSTTYNLQKTELF